MDLSEKEALPFALIEHLGPHALTGTKVTPIDAFEKGWHAHIKFAASRSSAVPVAAENYRGTVRVADSEWQARAGFVYTQEVVPVAAVQAQVDAVRTAAYNVANNLGEYALAMPTQDMADVLSGYAADLFAALQSPPVSDKVAVSLTDAQCEAIKINAALLTDNWADSLAYEPSSAEVDGVYVRDIVQQAAALSQPPAVEAPSDDGPSRDWAEDFSHENGQYEGKCFTCESRFLGHKRRVTCKQCAALVPLPKVDAASDTLTAAFNELKDRLQGIMIYDPATATYSIPAKEFLDSVNVIQDRAALRAPLPKAEAAIALTHQRMLNAGFVTCGSGIDGVLYLGTIKDAEALAPLRSPASRRCCDAQA